MTFGLEKIITDPEIIIFIVFSVLAVIRTLLDIIMWQVLVWLFHPRINFVNFLTKKGLNRYSLAQIISFIISTFISYYINKIITFNDNNPTTIIVIVKFFILNLIGLVASVWVIEYMTENKILFENFKKNPFIKKNWPMIAKITTIIITLFINFFGQKYWIFS